MNVQLKNAPELVSITPEIATRLLEKNGLNRPLSDSHVDRLAKQIRDGKWQINGDTIKIADTEDVLDGQHRLWAIIQASQAVQTYIVYGIRREAFTTIDTLRRPRSGGDVLALAGAERYRNVAANALMWLIRYQRKCLESFRDPKNRIENSDIETTFAENPNIIKAVERAISLKGVMTPSVLAFLYYVVSSRNQELADRMISTLANPTGISMDDPFFRLRGWALTRKQTGTDRDPIMAIALTIKAVNAAHAGRSIRVLRWSGQGVNAEEFPKLEL
jgi:hypothetical protein